MLSVLLGALMTYAWQGICGNRADWLMCRGLQQLKELLLKEYEAPVNHDVVQGLIASFFGAMHDAARQLATIASVAEETEFVARLTTLLKDGVDVDPSKEKKLLDALTHNLTAILAMGETGKIQRGQVSEKVAKAALSWIEAEVGEAMPPSLEAVFLHGGRRNGAALQSWTQFYRGRVAELIKTNVRFRSIVDSHHLAAMAEEQKEQRAKLANVAEWVKPSTWPAYVDMHAVEKPDFVSRNVSGGISFSYVDDPSNVDITADAPFYLRIESQSTEQAVLLEGYRGEWQVVPLNGNSPTKWVLCNSPETFLPPEFPLKTEDLGVHRFVILSVTNALRGEIADVVNASGELFPENLQNKLVERLEAAPPDEFRLLAGQIVVRSRK